MAEGLFRAGLGLLPVLCFLSALLFLDSYKLVKLRAVVLVVGAGAGAPGIFAMLGVAALGQGRQAALRGFLAGLSLAVVLHSAFNHFFFSPMLSTVGIVIAVPVLLNLVFQASEKAVGTWLGKGFDAD